MSLLALLLIAATGLSCKDTEPEPLPLSGIQLQLVTRDGCPNNAGIAASRYALSLRFNGDRGFPADSLLLSIAVFEDGELQDSFLFYNRKLFRFPELGLYPYDRVGDSIGVEICLWHNDQAQLELIGTLLRPDGVPILNNQLYYGSGDVPRDQSFRISVPNPREPFEVTALSSTFFVLNEDNAPIPGQDNYTSYLVDVEYSGEDAEFATGRTFIELVGFHYDASDGSNNFGGRRFHYFPPKVDFITPGGGETDTMFKQPGRSAYRMAYPIRFGPSEIVGFALSATVYCESPLVKTPLSRLRNVAYFGRSTTDFYLRNSFPASIEISRPFGAN